MVVANGTIVGMHYTLTDELGYLYETTVGTEPFYYLHGSGSMISGIERETEGMKPGDTKHISLSPREGYGERKDNRVFTLPTSLFDEPQGLRAGMRIKVNFDGKPVFFSILKKNNDEVTLDGNHPLAGLNLTINIEIVSVRKATDQEVDNSLNKNLALNN